MDTGDGPLHGCAIGGKLVGALESAVTKYCVLGVLDGLVRLLDAAHSLLRIRIR